jgi:hypothetical protein
MRIAGILLDIGGGVFVLLGLLHAHYTYLDIDFRSIGLRRSRFARCAILPPTPRNSRK